MRGFFYIDYILSVGLIVNTLAVVITTPPYSPLTATAVNYVETALEAGIKLVGVFFYQDGAMHANEHISIATDEYQAICHWQRLQQTYALPLYVCVTAAEKRGVILGELTDEIVNKSFTVSGLGELVELTSKASRLVQF